MYCERSGGQGIQYDSPLSMPSWDAAHKIDFGSLFLADRRLSDSLEPAVKFLQHIFDGNFVGFRTARAAAGFGIGGSGQECPVQKAAPPSEQALVKQLEAKVTRLKVL